MTIWDQLGGLASRKTWGGLG